MIKALPSFSLFNIQQQKNMKVIPVKSETLRIILFMDVHMSINSFISSEWQGRLGITYISFI